MTGKQILAYTLDLGTSIVYAVWQVAVLPSIHRKWATGDHLSAVLELLLPTAPLFFNLMSAARARGRNFGWGVLALLGPIGVAVVYRWPLRAEPDVPAEPGQGFQPNTLAIVCPVVQAILVVHTICTYPWDNPFQWVGDLMLFLLVSIFVCAWLGQVAESRGHPRAWGALGLLGLIGFAVTYTLPDRTLRPARGFPIEPMPGDKLQVAVVGYHGEGEP
jgi:hypothetical protein